jgi:hypothetical protein
MIAKAESRRELHARAFEPREELFRARNATKGRGRAIDGRDFHVPAQAPDLSAPAARSDHCFKFWFIPRNCDDMSATCGTQRFTEAPGREEMVGKVSTVEKKNVEVAVELAVLKTIVEQMNA